MTYSFEWKRIISHSQTFCYVALRAMKWLIDVISSVGASRPACFCDNAWSKNFPRQRREDDFNDQTGVTRQTCEREWWWWRWWKM